MRTLHSPVYYSRQLEAQTEMADRTNRKHVIYTGKNTKTSKKIKQLEREGKIKLERLDGLGPN